ncbi:hypothetical protein SprV_0301071300 [Sparganum proliferum]
MKRRQPSRSGKNASNANEAVTSEEYFETCNRFQGNFALRNGQTPSSDEGSIIQAIVQGETAPAPEVQKSRYRITLDYAYDPTDKALALDNSILEELIRILKPSTDSLESLSQADLLEGLKPVLHSLLSHLVNKSQSLEAERGLRPVPKPRSSSSSARLVMNMGVEKRAQEEEKEEEEKEAVQDVPGENFEEEKPPHEAAETVTTEGVAEAQENLQASDPVPAEKLEAAPNDDQLDAEPSPEAADYHNPTSDYQSGETNVAENESLKTVPSKSQPSERSIPEHSLANSVQDPKLSQVLVATLSVSTSSSIQRIESSQFIANASLVNEAPNDNGGEIELQAPQYYTIEVAVDGPVLTDPEQIGGSVGASVIEGIQISAVDELGREANITSMVSTDGKEIVVESVVDISSTAVVTQESAPYSEVNEDFIPPQDLPDESATNTKLTEDGNGQENLNENLLEPRDSPLLVLQVDSYDANEVVLQERLETIDRPAEVVGAIIQEEGLPDRPIPEIILDTQPTNEIEEVDSKVFKVSKKFTKRPDSRSRGSCEHSVIGIRASVDGSVLKLTQESEVCPADNSEDGGTEVTYNLDLLISWPKRRKSDSGGQLDLRVGLPGTEMKLASDGKSIEVSSSSNKAHKKNVSAEAEDETPLEMEYEKNDQNGSCSIPDGYTEVGLFDPYATERSSSHDFKTVQLSHQIGRFSVLTYRADVQVYPTERSVYPASIAQSLFTGVTDLKPVFPYLRHAFCTRKGSSEALCDVYRQNNASFRCEPDLAPLRPQTSPHWRREDGENEGNQDTRFQPIASKSLSFNPPPVQMTFTKLCLAVDNFASPKGHGLGVLGTLKSLLTTSSCKALKVAPRQGLLSCNQTAYIPHLPTKVVRKRRQGPLKSVGRRARVYQFFLPTRNATTPPEQHSHRSCLCTVLAALYTPLRQAKRLTKTTTIGSPSREAAADPAIPKPPTPECDQGTDVFGTESGAVFERALFS